MRRGVRAAAAVLGSAHPGPSVVVTLAAVGLGAAVGAEPVRVALLAAGVLIGQLSVGWGNDWLDAARDRAAGRTDKPVAVGSVSPTTVRAAALVSLVPGLLLPVLAAPAAGALHAVFVLCGWTYDLGLKATALSVLPYAVGFATLPSLGTLLLGPPRLAPWWATAAGAALGIAAHFANVVPDVEADAAAGIRGLPQLLGARASALLAPAVLLAGTALAVAGSGLQSPLTIVAAAVAALCAVAGVVSGLRTSPGRTPFRLVLVAGLALVVALIGAGARLVG
ncbi:UbiA family prenyltransferase [uncultured Amnibacterium sp.]|uniref:UbiA family prenyltransferase n=1 Tax=uncultured Amnibacterium sp. TaxID=1631851 RepID=UPI0035CB7CC9